MFFPRSSAAHPDPRRFGALRVSMNSPVVSVEEIPAGPARAAIVLWFEEDGDPSLVVRLRSQGTGSVVDYDWDETLGAAGEMESALDAALNFAESMGFLFDEDVLSGDDSIGRGKVIEAWQAFAGADDDLALELSNPLLEEAESPPEPSAPALELVDLFDELAPPPPEAAPASAEPEPAGPTLTKFRGGLPPDTAAAPELAPESPAPGRKALGRVPLVRRKRKKSAQERPSLLLRILGSF
jgi:hypothetical protein